MMKSIIAVLQALLLLALLFRPADAAEASVDLAYTIMKHDAIVFEQGFNNCDIDALNDVVAESLEFYHDQGDITQGKEAFLETTRNNICNLDYRPRRELLPNTTQIHPLYENGRLYGAIQMGEHRFLAKYEGKEEYVTSIASFTHLWIRKETGWKLARVLSYAHRSPDSAETRVRKSASTI